VGRIPYGHCAAGDILHDYGTGSNGRSSADTSQYDSRLSNPALLANDGLTGRSFPKSSRRVSLVLMASPRNPDMRRYLSTIADHRPSNHAIGSYRNMRSHRCLGVYKKRTESDVCVDGSFP
jgi:hypothetical protein